MSMKAHNQPDGHGLPHLNAPVPHFAASTADSSNGDATSPHEAPAVSRRRPKGVFLLVAGAMVVTVGAILAATGKLPMLGRAAGENETAKKAPAPRDPVAVTIAPVTSRPVLRSVPMVGTLQGFDQVTITPKVEGQVTAIYHEAGQIVGPGERLLQVDRTNYQKAVAEAENALAAELAKLAIALDEPEPHKIPALVRSRLERLSIQELPAVVKAARSERQARDQRDRIVKLAGTITEEELDRVRSEYDVAAANHRLAVVEAEATVAAAHQRLAALQTALQRLDDTTVVVPHPADDAMDSGTSPRSATDQSSPHAPREEIISRSEMTTLARPDEYVIAKRLVAVGTMVRSFPSVAVFELVRDHELKLMGSLPERYMGDVQQPRPGMPPQKVEIVTEGYPNQIFEGRVYMVSPVVDTASRTFPVEVRVPNPSRKLKAGSFAKARILAREEVAVPTVPEESIVPFAGVIKVFIVEDGKAHAVEVKPGARLEVKSGKRTQHWVEVKGDLPAGASVVTSGHSQLAEGTAVRTREPVPVP
jgi:RND family efflux transporter MFP subunit